MLKNLFLGLSIVILLVYFSASFLYDQHYVLYIKPLIIPIFLTYAFIASNYQLSLRYIAFVLLFYLGDATLLYMEVYPSLYIVGLLFYFFAYIFLLFLVLPFINSTSILKEIRPYSLFTFILIVCLLVFILDIIFDSESDIILHLVIVLNAISAILLAIFAFIYIKQLFFRKSILYFFGSFTLFFSDVLSALQVYYLEDFIINFIQRIFHFLGFYLIYLFYIENAVKKEVELF